MNRFDLYCIVTEEGKLAYSIVDSENPGAVELENEEFSEFIFKAETIEELAGMIHVDADILVQTINTYNETADNHDEDEFGVAYDNMASVKTAPYYAIVVRPLALAVYGGVVVNGESKVISADGTTIPNLFVVGEATYTASFAAVADALWSGAIAGNNAAAEILNK